MDYKAELEGIERIVDNNKLEKARLEERLKKLGEDKLEILTKLKEEGVEESKLEDIIISLEMEIQESIDKSKEILR